MPEYANRRLMNLAPAPDNHRYLDEVFCDRVMGRLSGAVDRHPSHREYAYMVECGFPVSRLTTMFHVSGARMGEILERTAA